MSSGTALARLKPLTVTSQSLFQAEPPRRAFVRRFYMHLRYFIRFLSTERYREARLTLFIARLGVSERLDSGQALSGEKIDTRAPTR